ncbi:hypothetical protein ACROYT_G019249 [Oculina patagonica]
MLTLPAPETHKSFLWHQEEGNERFAEEERHTSVRELETETAVVKSLKFQIDALEKEAARFKTCELEVIYTLKEQLATSKKENTKIMFEKDKELNERLQEETLKVFDQFKDRIALFMDENAKIISEKDKEMNELKKQKSKIIEQLEGEKWSIIGQFNERLAEKDKELNKLEHSDDNE